MELITKTIFGSFVVFWNNKMTKEHLEGALPKSSNYYATATEPDGPKELLWPIRLKMPAHNDARKQFLFLFISNWRVTLV